MKIKKVKVRIKENKNIRNLSQNRPDCYRSYEAEVVNTEETLSQLRAGQLLMKSMNILAPCHTTELTLARYNNDIEHLESYRDALKRRGEGRDTHSLCIGGNEYKCHKCIWCVDLMECNSIGSDTYDR